MLPSLPIQKAPQLMGGDIVKDQAAKNPVAKSETAKSQRSFESEMFVSPWRQTVIDTIRNLVILDQPLVLVTGPQGAGKTCIYNYLSGCFARQDQALLCWALRPNSRGGLLESLLRQIDVATQGYEGGLDLANESLLQARSAELEEPELEETVSVEAVAKALVQLSSQTAGVRVMIDNAQFLSSSDVAQLLGVIDATDFESIQFVLFAEKA